MKKTILLLFLLVFLTGCEAVCNIKIKDNEILNSCDFYATKSIKYQPNSPGVPEYDEINNYYYKQDYRAFYNDPLHEELFNKKIVEDDGLFGMNLNYSYSLNNFKNSSLLKYCDGNYKVDDKYIVLNIKDSSKCFTQDPYNHLDALNIKIRTNLKVLKNNADGVNGNVYSWNVEREDDKKDIYIKIGKASSTNFNYYIVLFVFIGLGISIFIFVKYLKNKTNSSNDF